MLKATFDFDNKECRKCEQQGLVVVTARTTIGDICGLVGEHSISLPCLPEYKLSKPLKGD